MNPEIQLIFPKRVQECLDKLSKTIQENIEEIRIRTGRPVEIIWMNGGGFLTLTGNLSDNPEEGLIISKEETLRMLNLISNHSLYALEEELRRGFVTLPGGHRVGMAGKVVLDKGHISHLKEITSLNFRIAREKKGAGEKIIPYLWKPSKVLNTLIISPPQCGKTTILRDLVRIFSYGIPQKKIPGYKIGVVDERSEIAGSVNGIPQNDVGPRTDVLDACPKADGMMMLIRSMSPQVLVVDEIGRLEDAQALSEAIHAGVSIITTAHGFDLDEISRRPTLAKIMQMGIFERYLVLSRRRGAGTLEGVYDQNCRLISGVRVS